MKDNSEKEGSTALMEESFLKCVLNGITDSIKIIDHDYNLVYTNHAGEKIAGKPANQLIGMGHKCFEEFHNNLEQCSYCITEQVFKTGEPAFNSFRLKKGRVGSIKELSAFPLKSKSGDVTHVIEIVRDVTQLKNDIADGEEFSEIVTDDVKMKEVFSMIESVATTNSTILINGETGTGKELIARSIHKASKRKDKKFLAINCGALSDTLLESELFGHERGSFTGADQRRIGKFEQADGGTIFLDEIGDISQAMQVKILRTLQEGEVTRVGGNETLKIDTRFICATNRDLKALSDSGEFREDLYYRINVVPIDLPPLREREGDIILLADHYLTVFNEMIGKSIHGFTTPVLNRMKRYTWPGNIRELRNLVERAVILSKGAIIEHIDIPGTDAEEDDFANSDNLELKDVARNAERKYLSKILKENKGNIHKTAELAGVNTRTIHRKMQEFGLNKESFK